MNNFSIKQFFNEYPYVPYLIAIAIVFILVVLTIVIVYQKKYTIVFKNGDEIIEKKKARKGSLLDLPTLEKEGETFVGWFFDKELTNQAYIYTFPKQNLKLYAKFVESVIDDEDEDAVLENSEENDMNSENLIETTETVLENEIVEEKPLIIEEEILDNSDSLDSSNLAEVVYEDSNVVHKNENFITIMKNSSKKNHDKFTEIANNLLKYRKVTYRYTKKECIFKCHGIIIARISFSGDNLKIYLSLKVEDYLDSNVKMRDASSVKKYEDTPLLLNLKTDKATKFLNNRLIDDLAKKFELTLKRGYKEKSYKSLVLALKDSPLIKSLKEDMLCDRVNVLDVDILSDEDAKGMFMYKNGVIAESIKNVPINLLEENFLPGSLIDLRQLKLKNLVSNDTLGIKIVGKGTLTKSFTVVCDDISLAAAKMILLTGGKVVLLIEEV